MTRLADESYRTEEMVWGVEDEVFHNYRFEKIEPHPYVRIVCVDPNTPVPKRLQGSYTNKEFAKKAIKAQLPTETNNNEPA